MNWAPELVRTEMDYRVERVVGDVRDNHLLARIRASEAHRSWWRRPRRPTDENGARSAA